jgi:hypothetical protein
MLRDYEVLVSVTTNDGYYSERLKRYVTKSIRKWIHIENVRHQDQAVALASKQGRRVLGVRKFDITRSTQAIENLELNQAPMTAIQMDEMIVNIKQQKKLDNRWKDKEKAFGIDNV